MTNLLLALWPLAGLLVAGATSAQPVSWFPLEAGTTQEFRIHTDLTVDRTERPRVRTFKHESSTIEAIAGSSPASVELRETRRLAGETGEPGPIRNDRVVLRATPWGIVQWPSDQDSEAGDPLRLLPRSPQPGERWQVGTLRLDDLAVDAEAETVGIEDLTLDGVTRSGCVHVAYRGDLAGKFTLAGEHREVDQGTWSADRWFCPDEGPVKEVARTDLVLTLPDLNEIHVDRLETRTRQP